MGGTRSVDTHRRVDAARGHGPHRKSSLAKTPPSRQKVMGNPRPISWLGGDKSCFPASVLDIKDPSLVTMAMGLEGFSGFGHLSTDRSEDVNVCTQLVSRLRVITS